MALKIRNVRAALVALCLLSGSGQLTADDFVWKTAGDGTYADKTKWLMNQGGVSVDAPRAPNASDTVTLRDGSYSVFLNGDSAGSFYAASDNTLSVGGGFTVGDFTGSPFITGGGTLTASTWALSPSNFTFPDAVINAGHVETGTFRMPGNALGLRIENGGTLNCTTYLHGSGFGRKPVWVSGTGSHFTVTSAITSAPQLEIRLDNGGGATLGAVSGGPEFYVSGTASVLRTGALTTAKFQIADGTAITDGNATLTAAGQTLSGSAQWFVNGRLVAQGTVGPTLTMTGESRLSADSLELDNRGHLVAGNGAISFVRIAIAGALTKRAGTLQADGAVIECGSAEFLAGEAAVGQISTEFLASYLHSAGPVTFNTQARMKGVSRLSTTRLILGREAGQRGILNVEGELNSLEIGEALVVGAAGQGTLTLQGSSVTVETPAIVIAESAGSTGHVQVSETDTVALAGALSVGKMGDGTLVVGTNARLEVSSAHELVVGADAGSYGHLTVNGSLAWLGAASFEEEATVVVGRGGRGQMNVSDTGQAIFKSCTVGESAEDNIVAILGPQPQSLQGNLDAEELIVGKGGRGSVTVDGSGRLTAARLKIGVNSTADNRVTIGSTAETALTEDSQIGVGGRGTLAVNGEVQLRGRLAVAEAPNSDGTVSVSGTAASLHGVNSTVVLGGGTGSTATLSMTSGAQARSSWLSLEPAPGSNATMTVNGSGTNLLVAENLKIGRLHRSAGTATATVSGGARVDVLRELRVGRTGVLDVTGGIVVVGSALTPPAGVLRVGVGGFAGIAGTLIGSEEIGAGARFAPGASPGTAQIQGSLTLQAGSTLELEIAGAAPGSGHDVVQTTGPLTVAGAVAIQFIDGFAPAAGQKFTVLRGGGALTWSPTGITVIGLAPGFSSTLLPDGAGNVVLTAINAGTAASQPILSITSSEIGVVLEWPATTGWILEEDHLTGQFTGWRAVNPAPTAEEGFFHLLRPPGSPARQFFRLRKP